MKSALSIASELSGISLATYGAKVDEIKAPIGAAVTQAEIEQALKAKKYKILTFTHVDTSTSVLSDAKAIAQTVQRVSPETLVNSSCVVFLFALY